MAPVTVAGVGSLVTNMIMTVVASKTAHADLEYAPYESEVGEEASVGTV